MNSAKDSQAERLIAMGQMAASLAHEIRNPLGGMELYCTLLKKDLAKQPEQLALAEHIHEGITRVKLVIANCLQFSKELRPKFKLFTRTEDLVTRICARPLEGKQHSTITIETWGEQFVSLDASLFEQVLVNLISNAVFAAEANSEQRPPRVRIRLGGDDAAFWQLNIVDTGLGMSAEVQQQAFDPFFTTRADGTGLGLSIVHTIVRAHGGEIAFSSDETGTDVCVKIPRRQDGVVDSERTREETYFTG